MVIDKIKKLNDIEDSSVPKRNVEAEEMLVGKWVKCDKCKEILYREDVRANFSVCPNCGKHFRISARRRLNQIIDEGTFEETYTNLQTTDPLQFEGYTKKKEVLQ